MNYLQNHSRSKAGRIKRYLIAAACAALVVLCIEWFAPYFFPGLFSSIARPFWRAEFSIDSGSLKSPAALLSENESLRRQLTDATVRLATYQDLQNQNDELKTLMGRASSTPRVLAAILVRPPLAPYDEFIIDAGGDKHFSTTSIAYAPGNVPIGRVVEVLGQTSTVSLFSSPGLRYDVLVGSTHIPATAVGQGGGQYSAQLPQAAKVSEGDMVIAAGAAASVSASAAPLGIVTAVLRDPSAPFETVLFAPPINIYQLRWVLVAPADVPIDAVVIPMLAPAQSPVVPVIQPKKAATKR